MTSQPRPRPHIDTSVPHSARVWNWVLGGKDHFEADEKLGEYLREHYPSALNVARASRDFLRRVVRTLVEEEGIRQFLDIGTGLPTADNTHEVAQRYASECRIVYVDNDPLVLTHARALLTTHPDGATDYVEADVRDPDTVFQEAAKTLDFDKPVALMLLSMLGHIDPDEAALLVQRYTARLAPGSFLATCDSINAPEMLKLNEDYAASGAVPYICRSPEQLAATATGLEILPPGVGPLNEWRPGGATLEPTYQWGLLARKP
ncbi:SAM-dependent methyltransferase [Streptomyces litchfieldiae]|uniref:SAM-dependent methyltransferase n=1 Tax=Streptomyces litchfieldiae TaxID=3075543 RepID=A0ABU2MTG8_9ACTN|nr:SAM-dependent methyltransferase [Streptomyces sp. DSM 44938]MDT0343884.1 SAM-dependent methyltransferase [Streptomyces sp. DSM 44938]